MSATQLYLIFHIYKVGRKADDSLLKKYDEVYMYKVHERTFYEKKRISRETERLIDYLLCSLKRVLIKCN